MITTINEFKIFESKNIDFKIYTRDEMVAYINRSGEYDIRFKKERDGGLNVFKYFQYSDYNNPHDKDEYVRFFAIIVDDIMVGLAHMRKNPNIDNQWWLSYLCVDPIFENNGYASQLSHFIFKWFKEKGLTFESSSYTESGMIKLKPLFNKLAKLYNVPFVDKGKF